MLTRPVTMVVVRGKSVPRFSGARRSDTALEKPFLLAVRATIKGRPDWREK